MHGHSRDPSVQNVRHLVLPLGLIAQIDNPDHALILLTSASLVDQIRDLADSGLSRYLLLRMLHGLFLALRPPSGSGGAWGLLVIGGMPVFLSGGFSGPDDRMAGGPLLPLCCLGEGSAGSANSRITNPEVFRRLGDTAVFP